MKHDPYSQEAEQAVLGAMLIKPELIDVLSFDLKESDFFFSDNRQVFKAIMALHGENKPVDVITVGEHIGLLHGGTPGIAYAADLYRNTPSAANAKAYVQTVMTRAVERSLIAAVHALQDIVDSDSGVEDKIAQAQAEIMSISSGNEDGEMISAREAIEQHCDELERREQLGGKIDGLTTGIDSLDQKLLGMKPEQLIVVAGRPKMGKTTLAMCISDHVAVDCGKSVLVYSLEMSVKQLMDKALAHVGSIPLNNLKDGTATTTHGSELLSASTKIANSKLSIFRRKSATINQIRAGARRHKMKHGLDLLIVDHIGLVNVEDMRANAVQRVSEVTRGLKLLAKELDCPVIALSQLNRALELRPNKRPIPSDLRDSGSIEQDADMIVFVYRDEVYNENTEYRGVAEVIIGVARDIEPCTVKTRFQGKYSSFSDLMADYEEPAPKPVRQYSRNSLLD